MTTHRMARPLLVRRRAARSFLALALTFTGLTAIIVGILAMHVWMNGHGSTSHHITTSHHLTASSAPAAAGAGVEAQVPGTPAHTSDFGADRALSGALAGIAALNADLTGASSSTVPGALSGADAHGGMLAGCGGDCAGEMMLGMCVLAMITVGFIALRSPAARALVSTVVRRGPPVLSWTTSRPAPAPSLIRLCISRT